MNIQKQIDELLTQRASQWVDILRAGKPQDLSEFAKWVSESPRNLDEFLTCAALDEALGDAELYRSFDRNAVLGQIRVSRVERKLFGRVPDDTKSHHRHMTWLGALAASVCAIAVICLAWQYWPSYGYKTRIGEQRSFNLPDGTVMHLNTQSHVEARFDEHKRELLLDDGEAVFKVARDTHRPFEVRTPQAIVKALGTEFNVLTRPGTGTRVAVLEGRVQIAAVKQPTAPPKALDSGQEADVSLNGPIQVNAHADVAKAIAWRQRRLVFSQAALEDIVQEFNRYNHMRLRLEDVQTGAYHFSGTFDADDLEALVVNLSREPDLKIERHGEEIVIRKR